MRWQSRLGQKGTFERIEIGEEQVSGGCRCSREHRSGKRKFRVSGGQRKMSKRDEREQEEEGLGGEERPPLLRELAKFLCIKIAYVNF